MNLNQSTIIRKPTSDELTQINLSLQWLSTLIQSPTVPWKDGQKESAQASLELSRGHLINIMMGMPPGRS